MDYRPRVMDSLLADSLEAVGAVVIEGPRAVGKTNRTCALVGFEQSP